MKITDCFIKYLLESMPRPSKRDTKMDEEQKRENHNWYRSGRADEKNDIIRRKCRLSRNRERNPACDALGHAKWHVSAVTSRRTCVYHYIPRPIVPVYCVSHRLEESHDIITSRDLSVRLHDVDGIIDRRASAWRTYRKRLEDTTS